jgi:hypothetical protein
MDTISSLIDRARSFLQFLRPGALAISAKCQKTEAEQVAGLKWRNWHIFRCETGSALYFQRWQRLESLIRAGPFLIRAIENGFD